MDKKQVLKEKIDELIMVVKGLKEENERLEILEEDESMIEFNEIVIKQAEAKIGKYMVMLNSIEE